MLKRLFLAGSLTLAGCGGDGLETCDDRIRAAGVPSGVECVPRPDPAGGPTVLSCAWSDQSGARWVILAWPTCDLIEVR